MDNDKEEAMIKRRRAGQVGHGGLACSRSDRHSPAPTRDVRTEGEFFRGQQRVNALYEYDPSIDQGTTQRSSLKLLI
jgi:hypothetical protein